MRKILIAVLLFSFGSIYAQDTYWVFFTDKKENNFNPYEYFDQKAILRRMKNNLPLSHSTDWPVNKQYIDKVSAIAENIIGKTRWFNAVAVNANAEQISKIQELKFVSKIRIIRTDARLTEAKKSCGGLSNDAIQKRQLEVMGYSKFKEAGIDGKGVRIAIFDGGFPGVNTVNAFKNIRNDSRLIKTWDFTKGNVNVFRSIQHGTNVMSNIGGVDDDGNPLGMATGAEFMLAKTEINTEPYKEEVYWLEAVEWADKNGADLINSSLGYTYSRYFPEDMNGEKSLVSRAGNMAARKGILVVNAAGNDGDNDWKNISTPADADSVLSIGGVEPTSLLKINFSSMGPTSTGIMKPNVCAFGKAVVANKRGMYSISFGTSFSSPLVAGFAACVIQANPKMKNMEIFELIEKSGHLYPYFDYSHGFGIPQASYILSKSKTETLADYILYENDKGISIKINKPSSFIIGQSSYVYVNIMDDKGFVMAHKVMRASENIFQLYSLSEIEYASSNFDYSGKITINVFMEGLIKKHTIN